MHFEMDGETHPQSDQTEEGFSVLLKIVLFGNAGLSLQMLCMRNISPFT